LISVVIPTHARPTTLRRVLDGLAAQTADGFETIVVHDTGDAVEHALGPHLVALDGGPSAKRNAGVEAAGGEVILFLDDDVIPEPGLVAAHAKAHADDPNAATGALGHVRWADELRPTPLMEWLDEGVQFDYGTIVGDEAQWWHFYTANLSLKRALFQQAGGFDVERFPFGHEDLDLGYRLSQRGLTLRYLPQARAQHLNAPSLDEWRRRVARIARSERAFVEAHPELAPPYFHTRFTEIAAQPATRGITGRLQPLIPKGTPWLGPRAWVSAKLHAEHEVARAYLAAW
jgi:GT2 family glycosyltransferase